jgi:rare lipoprotein A
MRSAHSWLAVSVLATVISGYEAASGAPSSDEGGVVRTKVKALPSPAHRAKEATKKKTISSRGIASFYGVNTNGTRTASGVPLKDSVSTAAHRTLPFGTLVRVTNLRNGLRVTVKITDRGPYIKGRIIDLSRHAARKLDMIEAGIVSVEIEILPESPAPIQPSLAGD